MFNGITKYHPPLPACTRTSTCTCTFLQTTEPWHSTDPRDGVPAPTRELCVPFTPFYRIKTSEFPQRMTRAPPAGINAKMPARCKNAADIGDADHFGGRGGKYFPVNGVWAGNATFSLCLLAKETQELRPGPRKTRARPRGTFPRVLNCGNALPSSKFPAPAVSLILPDSMAVKAET